MRLIQKVAFRFISWLLLNLLFILSTLLLVRRQKIPVNPELALDIIKILSLGSVYALGVIYFSIRWSDEMFSRRLAGSSLLAMTLVMIFRRVDLGCYLGIQNPSLSAIFTTMTFVIVINCTLQLLHRFSPQHFR